MNWTQWEPALYPRSVYPITNGDSRERRERPDDPREREEVTCGHCNGTGIRSRLKYYDKTSARQQHLSRQVSRFIIEHALKERKNWIGSEQGFVRRYGFPDSWKYWISKPRLYEVLSVERAYKICYAIATERAIRQLELGSYEM